MSGLSLRKLHYHQKRYFKHQLGPVRTSVEDETKNVISFVALTLWNALLADLGFSKRELTRHSSIPPHCGVSKKFTSDQTSFKNTAPLLVGNSGGWQTAKAAGGGTRAPDRSLQYAIDCIRLRTGYDAVEVIQRFARLPYLAIKAVLRSLRRRKPSCSRVVG